MNTTANAADINVQGNAAQVFQFKQQQEVRAVLIDGEPWFVANDVAASLGYRDAHNMTRILDDDERGTHIVSTPSGEQEMLVINESGLYSAILRSRKPEAKAFKKWVTAEVLPAIRKHGMYLHTPAMRPSLTREHWEELVKEIGMATGAWCFRDSERGWIYNHLRIVFQVPKAADIPDEHFDTALQIIRSKRDAAHQFVSFVAEAREWFAQEVLGQGYPWTPAIKARLSRQLKRQIILPPKTDWLALAKMADQKAEGSAAA